MTNPPCQDLRTPRVGNSARQAWKAARRQAEKGEKGVKKTKKNDGFMVVYGDFMMISLCFYGGFMVGECF